MKTRLSRLFLFIIGVLFLWTILAQCVISKNRWKDSKALKIFKQREVDLKIFDTLINHRRLHYAVTGHDSLPLLVFIHGSPGSWMNYHRYLSDSALLSRFQMLAVDRPGFGFSQFGDAMHLEEQSDLLFPIIKVHGKSRKVFLFGHSYGGPLAIALAARDSTLVHTVVVAAGSIDPTLEKKETWRRIMNVRPMFWLLPGSFAPSNSELLYLKKDLIPFQQDFANVKANVWFIHGDKDSWVPIANVEHGLKMLVNSRSTRIDTLQGADHQIPWKNYDRIKATLLELN